MAFKFTRTSIPDVVIIEPTVYEDGRGFFAETFKKSEFEREGMPTEFVQDNHSLSRKGVIRGLHYQLKKRPMGKLVSVIEGSITDVAVDIRKSSESYGKHVMVELSERNRRMLWVPEGFAHGFLSLENNTHVIYKCTGEYSKEMERAIIWNDPDLNIKWRMENPILSEKDKLHPRLKDAENDF